MEIPTLISVSCPGVLAGVGACGGPSGGFLSRKTSRQPPAAAAPTSSIHRAHISLLQRHASACVFGSESCVYVVPFAAGAPRESCGEGWVPRLEPDEEAPIARVDYASQPATPRAQG